MCAKEILKQAISQWGCGWASACSKKGPGHRCSSSLVMTGPQHPHNTHTASLLLAAHKLWGPPTQAQRRSVPACGSWEWRATACT